MSYILDALRRSEQERGTDNKSPALTAIAQETVAKPRVRRAGAWVFVGGLIAFGIAATYGFRMWNASRVDEPGAAVVAQAPADGTQPASPVVAPVDTSPVTTTPPPAPVLKSVPFTQSSHDTNVRDLAEQARVPKRRSVERASKPVAVAPAAVARSTPRVVDDIRFLRGMPPEFQRGLPEMIVNIHVYTPDIAERILYINNHQYQVGDKVRDDVIVEEIVEDGVVMNQRGQRFKLPRPS